MARIEAAMAARRMRRALYLRPLRWRLRRGMRLMRWVKTSPVRRTPQGL